MIFLQRKIGMEYSPFRRGGDEGMMAFRHPCLTTPPSGRGTRLRTCSQKPCHRHAFFCFAALSGFESLYKKINRPSRTVLFAAGAQP